MTDQSSNGCICNDTLFIAAAIDSEDNVLFILISRTSNLQRHGGYVRNQSRPEEKKAAIVRN